MEQNVKYLVGLLEFLGMSAKDFYTIGITSDKITLQGRYKADFAKQFAEWIINKQNGYLEKDGVWDTAPQETASMSINYKIILTD